MIFERSLRFRVRDGVRVRTEGVSGNMFLVKCVFEQA